LAETQGSGSGSSTRPQGVEGSSANGLDLEGFLSYNYQYAGNSGTLRMTAERVRNSRVGGTSGTLQLQLWATTTAPIFGQTINAYTLGTFTLGQLSGGTSFTNVDTGLIGFTPPPAGTYYVTMALMEFDGAQFRYQDLFTFSGLETFGPSAACTTTSTTLCLNNGRFRVTVTWQTTTASGVGNAVSITNDTGYFWFFSSNNVEMVIKVVNGCGFNSRYWVFSGGLTNVNVTISVTDTQTGAVKFYQNPLNTAFQPIQDTAAFATCP
jgi:hypothetical protein